MRPFRVAHRLTLIGAGVTLAAASALTAAPASAVTAPPGGGGGGGCSATGAAVCPSKCAKPDTFGEVHGNYIYFYKYVSRDSYGYWKFDVGSPIPPNPARHVGYAYKLCG